MSIMHTNVFLCIVILLLVAVQLWYSRLLALGISLTTQETRSCPDTTAAVRELQKSFEQIVQESGSDKFSRHHYERYYTKWLEPFRSKIGIKLLEIGARQGRSMKLWNEYFTNAPELLMGLAYASGTQNLRKNVQALDKITIHFGDQSKTETMNYLKEKGSWDVIIDDGSHFPQHMIFSLYSLWPSVKPGGIYVIEDLETNYWPAGDSLYGYVFKGTGIGAAAEFSFVTKLEQIQQVLARRQIGASELSVMPGDHEICSIEWGMNIVVLNKCNDDGKPFAPLRPRRYDQAKMTKWIEMARSSNPDGFPMT